MIQKDQEIKALTDENHELKKEISRLNNHILKMEKDHKEETDRLTRQLDKIFGLFPAIKEWLRIEELCRIIGFGKDMIKDLINRKSVTFSGSLYSPDFKRDFKTERSTAKVEPHPEQRGKLRLMIDGVSDSTWFRNKRTEFLQRIGIKQRQAQQEEHGKRKGIKL